MTRQTQKQKNPQRDMALTESLHRLLRRVKPPQRPVDGIPLRELGVVGIVQMDIRFLAAK